MEPQDHDLRVCPTRIDGSPVLFAHKVDKPKCQERQRQGYHKCFSCAYNNSYVAKHGLPQPVATQAPDGETVKAG